MGAPALTQAIVDQFGDAARVSMYAETAAQAMGVHRSTYYRWLRRGAHWDREDREGRPVPPEDMLYLKFSRAVMVSRSEAEMRLLRAIETAGDRQWTALAWMLERRFPERYGQAALRLEIAAGKERIAYLERTLESLLARLGANGANGAHPAAPVVPAPPAPPVPLAAPVPPPVPPPVLPATPTTPTTPPSEGGTL